jgi:hypothetical protein
MLIVLVLKRGFLDYQWIAIDAQTNEMVANGTAWTEAGAKRKAYRELAIEVQL